jgi:hypothetical protein
MTPLFFQHLTQWWTELSQSGRLALLAVALGGCIVVTTTWLGIRQWWQRWKQEGTDDA